MNANECVNQYREEIKKGNSRPEQLETQLDESEEEYFRERTTKRRI